MVLSRLYTAGTGLPCAEKTSRCAFEASLDGADFEAVPNAVSLTGLSNGDHRFSVRYACADTRWMCAWVLFCALAVCSAFALRWRACWAPSSEKSKGRNVWLCMFFTGEGGFRRESAAHMPVLKAVFDVYSCRCRRPVRLVEPYTNGAILMTFVVRSFCAQPRCPHTFR